MYPLIRLATGIARARRAARLGLFDTHVSQHICWPWDIDPWSELNNGRTLTLYDLGRLPLAVRTGLVDTLRRHRWGLTVAGSSTRYRRRIRMFDRFEMRSRALGWDGRFLYIDQSMWRGDDCTSQVLIRMAFTGRAGIVPPAEVVTAMGLPADSPALPGWVAAWIAAEAERPWPPAP
ncbi:acyl-CoA thioesterase [Frigidibacter oleivorans]|uniref:acyl-CoA thioesterase n=1 Tax=Frigidibacter oleivorans TaxID=2487129 RepID=UPI000F8C8760|nr:acyl-CoA thioesterase [Frigidibacter oleivorans]